MNAISGLRRNALDVMVQRLAVELTEELSKHRLDNFPPAAAKEFRRITATEATRFLGVTDSYLRQIAAELFGPTEPGQTRRSYTLHDLDVLRRAMADRSRSPGKFVPARRDGERLQSIAVVNFKGGSAKTTTAANLSQYLALYGYRVLAIDLDPQASLTTVFGIAPETGVRDNESLYGAIRYDGDRVSPETIIRETYIPGLSVIPGALELISAACKAGVVVSLGHTDANFAQATSAITAGARHAAHVFNAMRPFEHRETGVIGAVLTATQVTAELIADGVHVDAAAIRILLAAKGTRGVILVSDGTAATGMPDGTYRLGTFEVKVAGGVCRSADGKLAGSTLTLDRALRNVVELGVPLADAIAMLTANPARLLGLEGRKGALAPGADADIVLLDSNLEVAGVMTRGAGLVAPA